MPIYLHPTDMICLSEYVLCVELEHDWGTEHNLQYWRTPIFIGSFKSDPLRIRVI